MCDILQLPRAYPDILAAVGARAHIDGIPRLPLLVITYALLKLLRGRIDDRPVGSNQPCVIALAPRAGSDITDHDPQFRKCFLHDAGRLVTFAITVRSTDVMTVNPVAISSTAAHRATPLHACRLLHV